MGRCLMFNSLRNALMVLLVVCTACGTQSQQSSRLQTDEDENDPAFGYTQAATFLEPLPEKMVTDAQALSQQAIGKQDSLKLPPVKPLEVKGNIAIAGSSSLEELNNLMYQRFVQQGYADIITFNGSASSADGIELFCQGGEIDILTTTRPLQTSEIATCQANGRQVVEFPIGKDALVVVVNRLDTFAKNITRSQLAILLSAQNWSQVNPKWPKKPIKRFLIEPKFSHINLVVEKVFAGDSQAITNSLNTNFYKFPAPLIQDLSTTRYGVGVLNYPAYQSTARSLRPLVVEGVAANVQSLQNDTYPLGRTLFLYTDRKHFQQKQQVSAFINFYLTYVNQEISKASYFPLSQQQLNDAKGNWLKAMELN